MKKALILIGILILLVSCGSTHYFVSIEGHVYDGKTKQPIKGAIVFDSYKTDKNGYFSFEYGGIFVGLTFTNPAERTVTITKEGYKTKSIVVGSVEDDYQIFLEAD